MDPILALKEFVTAEQLDQVVETGSHVDFGGRYNYENTTPTAYKSQQGKGDFYDLQSLIFFARFLGPGYHFMDYFKAAKEKGLMQVKLIDSKDLEGYLTGKREAPKNLQISESGFLGAEEAPDAKRARLDASAATASAAAPDAAEQSALRSILINERQLRDRNTMLSIPGRSFQRVVDILQGVLQEDGAVMARDRAARQEAARKAEEEARRQRAKDVSAPKPSGRFERETDTSGALKQIGGGNLGLQNVGFGAAPLPQMPSGSTAPGVRPQDEVPPPPPPQVQPSSQPSRPRQPPPSAPRSSQKAPLPPSSSSGQQHQQRPPSKSKDPPRKPPIILVPPAATALINMYNAKQFLGGSVYVTPQDAEASGTTREKRIQMKRTVGRKTPVDYIITDQEPTRQEDWDRVVGVVCLGKPWQFKKWPFEGAATGDMVATFQKLAGVYIHFADEPVDPAVKKWNVKLLGISRHNRNKDDAVAREFWAHLDAFLQSRKCSLLY